MTVFTPLTPLLASNAGPLADALRRLPRFVELTDALERCAQAAAQRRAELENPPRSAVLDDLLTALHAGQDVPPGLDEQAGDAVTSTARTSAALELLTAAEQRLAGDRDEVVRAGADDLCAELDAQVRDLVEQARALDLRGAADAEDALERGAGEAWTELTRLRGRYFLVREAQRRLAESLIGGAQHLDTFAFLRNYADFVPRWWEAGSGAARFSLIDRPDGGAVSTTHPDSVAPWPDDPAGRFLWLVQHREARPWVPTRRQLEQAHAAAVEARHAAEAAEQEPVDPAVIRRQEQRMAHYQQRLAVEQDRAHAGA